MRKLASLFSFLFIIGFASTAPASNIGNQPRTTLFDEGWRFIKENPSGAENPGFDDSAWRIVNLPHDWSIEDLPNQIPDSIVGPFSKASIGKMGTGYTIGGTAWYRKNFTINEIDKGKIVYLQFDGVYMNSDVWVNGKHAGGHPYGYTSFYYDITPLLNPAGQSNSIAVQVKNEGRTARWYSGSGIYRHTWLTLVNTAHIGVWGVNVKTPVVSDQTSDVNVVTKVVNSGTADINAVVQVEFLDPSGKIVAKKQANVNVPKGANNNIEQTLTVTKPSLWSTETPTLYTAKVSVLVGNKVSDNLVTTFGIRSIRFTAKEGFLLNGKSVELKGGCFHHDNGPLGSAAIDRAEERKMEILKNAGLNSIRCSHNPPSPYLLDVCDRLGILVIDEIFDNWEQQKVSADDYSKSFKEWWQKDLELMVTRDRNHPSVILWSVGNEIREALDTAGLRIATKLTNEIRRLDKTRGITLAFNDFSGRRGEKSRWDDAAPQMALFDVVGYNYLYSIYEADHEKHPERVMAATEFMPLYSLENWTMVEKHPYVIGNFAWVVMDYLGEAGVGVSRYVNDEGPNAKPAAPGAMAGGFFNRDPWPIFNDYQGDIDLIGNKKARYYHQLVVWRQSKIEILVHQPIPAGKKENVSPWGWPEEQKSWSWPGHENEKLQVHVYTRSKSVKLELNGKLIGEQAVDGEKSITATFEVPYEPGKLVAHCYDAAGKEVASETVKTVGKPSSIRLTADRSSIKADPNDLAYIMTEVLDAEGNVIPWANDITINYAVSGNGKLAGVGNGNPREMASFIQPKHKTFQGKCLAILKPELKPGKMTIKAIADGLKEANLEIAVK
ncbi:MAG: glycoside hydrolase family 2 TIM barrel-domain containing protein [Mariniphaga sp.]